MTIYEALRQELLAVATGNDTERIPEACSLLTQLDEIEMMSHGCR